MGDHHFPELLFDEIRSLAPQGDIRSLDMGFDFIKHRFNLLSLGLHDGKLFGGCLLGFQNGSNESAGVVRAFHCVFDYPYRDASPSLLSESGPHRRRVRAKRRAKD